MKHISNTAIILIILATFSTVSRAQNNEQNVIVTVRPTQTVEERVADSIKEKVLRSFNKHSASHTADTSGCTSEPVN